MVFIQFQIVFSSSIYMYQTATILRGSNFLWPYSGCGPILVCKIHKMQKKNWTLLFFHSLYCKDSKNVRFLLLIKNSHGITFPPILYVILAEPRTLLQGPLAFTDDSLCYNRNSKEVISMTRGSSTSRWKPQIWMRDI